MLQMKIVVSVFLLLGLYTTVVDAQDSLSLSGRVTYDQQLPLSGAIVQLINKTDSLFKQTVATDSLGNYQFVNLNKGSYLLTIGMIGYQRQRLPVTLDHAAVKMPILLMLPTSVSLRTVAIFGKKALIEQKIDRTVVNVEAMVSTSGGTALDVLEKSPGVSVGQNGEINFKGKRVTIFIDDKPTYLSGADLENYLRSLSAAGLDQIELMANPPAKYDAAGNGGVINIKTKRVKIKGINGAVNLSGIQGKYLRTNNSINLNYRNSKVNIASNISYITSNNYSDLDINRLFKDTNGLPVATLLQHSFTRNTGEAVNANIGLDYYVSDKTTIGIALTGVYRPSRKKDVVNTQFLNPSNALDSTIAANNDERGKFKNAGVNLNYRHQFDKNGKALKIDADYLNYHLKRQQAFLNVSSLVSGAETNNEILSGSLPTNINIYALKGDYSHPLNGGYMLSTGLKSNITLTDNEANYYNTVANLASIDYSKTNHFKYRENINAAYLNATKEFKKLTIQTGFRLENTNSTGHQLGNTQKADSTFNKNYTSLFTTLYLQYRLDTGGNHQFGFNYGRRIDRPYYQDLNPFISPIDKFTYYTGNPFLKPSYTQGLELTHTYKNKITTSLSYSKILDQMNETIEIINRIYYSHPGNIGKSIFKSVSINGNFSPFSWLDLNVYMQLTNIHATGQFYTGYLDTKGSFIFIQPLLQFKLGKEWFLQFDGYYQGKVTNVQFVAGDQKRLNMAISKKISASTTLKLVVNDVFHSYVNSGVIGNLAQTNAEYRNVVDTQTAILSLSYRFGKAISDQRKHDAGSAATEQGRVKN